MDENVRKKFFDEKVNMFLLQVNVVFLYFGITLLKYQYLISCYFYLKHSSPIHVELIPLERGLS